MNIPIIFKDMINYGRPGASLGSFLKIEKVENLKQYFPCKYLKRYEHLNKMYVIKIDDFFNDTKNEPMSKKDFKAFVNIMK